MHPKSEEGYKLNIISICISILITTIIVCVFIFSNASFSHWFVLPVYLCGILILIDAVNWARGEIQLLDPIGFIGLFGYHFFFLAPLLFIHWENTMSYVVNPDDWRVWIGILSIINLVGLIIYMSTRNAFLNKFIGNNKKQSTWLIDKKKANILLPVSLIITFLIQTYIYLQLGGIAGYIKVYTEGEGSFSGMGWLFMISESFPVLLIMYLAINSNNKVKKTFLYIMLLFVVLFVLRMYFGGLRGSRSNTIWVLIWVAGIIHLWIRPLSRKFIILGLTIVLMFAFVYGVYKGSRGDFASIFNDEVTIGDLAEENNRGIKTLLLGDLSRTGIQSFVIYRQTLLSDEYSLALGRSYIGDLAIVVPKIIWPSRPPTVVKEGTEILKGKNTFVENGYRSSRIHGLQGEFSLNFGYLLSPFVFIVFSIYIAKIRSLLFVLQKKDVRTLIYPFLLITCFLLLVQDLDNFIYGIIKNLSVPLIVLLLGMKKVPS